MNRVITTATSKPCGDWFKPLAMAQTNSGAPTTPNALVTSKAQISKVATWLISTWVASSPFC